MISLLCVLLSLSFAGPDKAPKIESAKPEHNAVLMDVEDKYQKASGITMEVQKTDKISLLDQTRKFSGSMKIKKGKFRLELQTDDASHDTSIVVADGKTLWLVAPPPKEFKEAKTQVTRVSVNNKGIKAQGFLQILTQGGILKHFTVSGVNENGDDATFFLSPKTASSEFRRAQLTVSKKNQTIDSLQYWDEQNNETIYTFSKVDFQKPIDDKLLKYTPPKDADVTKL